MLEYFINNLCLQGHKRSLYSVFKTSFCRGDTVQAGKHGRLLHRRGGIEMETRGRRGKHLSAMTKTACHLSDTWTVAVPAGNVTLYPGSLLHSLSSCQCCRFIVTLYQIVINMESLVVQHEMCSAT